MLNLLIKNGARLAENGEFSKRAFMNGKMSLDEAEGIIDVIDATQKAELEAGFELLNGRLVKTIKQIQNELTTLSASLAVTVDYPEYDDEPQELGFAKIQIESVKQKIKELLVNSEYGKQLKSGVKVAIVGKPNVGKSSILNTLLGEERAIVTNVAGTTRDSISEQMTYKGLKIELIDTAGLREGSDIVEKLGIERTKNLIKSANLVVFVISAEGVDDYDKEIYDQIKQYKPLIVLNKTDLKNNNQNVFKPDVEISALKGEDYTKLLDAIVDKVLVEKVDNSALVLTNQRHINALNDAVICCDKILNIVGSQTVDIVLFEINNLWSVLGKITGESENEKIIDEIFARFCLGK